MLPWPCSLAEQDWKKIHAAKKSCCFRDHILDFFMQYVDLLIRICILLHWLLSFQVYPRSWTAIYMPLDNVGMWNVRSENWVRQYLGQQFYLRVYSPANSWRDEYPIPKNALLCGLASGRRTRPLWCIYDRAHKLWEIREVQQASKQANKSKTWSWLTISIQLLYFCVSFRQALHLSQPNLIPRIYGMFMPSVTFALLPKLQPNILLKHWLYQIKMLTMVDRTCGILLKEMTQKAPVFWLSGRIMSSQAMQLCIMKLLPLSWNKYKNHSKTAYMILSYLILKVAGNTSRDILNL